MRYFVSTLVLLLAGACTADDAAPGDINALSSAQSDSSLLMNVMDVFKIRDTVLITGKIERGTISNSGTLCLNTTAGSKIEVSVLALSLSSKLVENASEGAIVGVQVTGVVKDDVSKGDTITESCD